MELRLHPEQQAQTGIGRCLWCNAPKHGRAALISKASMVNMHLSRSSKPDSKQRSERMGMPTLKSFRHAWTLLCAISLLVMLAACGSGGGTTGTGSGAKGLSNALNACPKTSTTTAASAESGTITLNVAG